MLSPDGIRDPNLAGRPVMDGAESVRLCGQAGSAMRLDVFLVAQLPRLSRRRVRQWVKQGNVRVNGQRAASGSQVRSDDVVTFRWPMSQGPEALEAEPGLDVLVVHEDADVVAIDKPAGMPSLALRADERGTVGNFLVARYPDLRGIGAGLECGIAHRLDTGTSGIMLVARNATAHSELRRQFGNRSVQKEYLAVVEGDLGEEGRIDCPIAHARRHRRRMIACPDPAEARSLRARPALTRYSPMARYGESTLVRVTMSTGVRHQIRVHLARAGHPISGDPLYGETPGAGNNPPHLMLHALRVGFRHTARGERFVLSTPWPSRFPSPPKPPRS